MADGRHVGKYSKCHNSPTNGTTGTQIGWSHPIMSPTCPPWCGCHGNGRCLATVQRNGALNILQLWASGSRTREPILMKFGKQTQIMTTMTVTWSNIIFLNSKWRTAAMLENIRNVITRLSMYRLRPNLGGHITSCPRHVPHDSVAMATAVA